jgi:transcriptional regulator with XRE-family HTH domain
MGERIVVLRKDREWSTYGLAKKAELSESYLGQLEHGKHEPSLTTLLKLTHAFGFCSVEELLAGTRLGTGQLLEVLRQSPPAS